jgi:hypothetical protein
LRRGVFVFFYLPKSESPNELAHSVWTRTSQATRLSREHSWCVPLSRVRKIPAHCSTHGIFLALSGCIDLCTFTDGTRHGHGRMVRSPVGGAGCTHSDCRHMEAGGTRTRSIHPCRE